MDRALAYRNNPLSSLGKGVCGTGDEALRRDRRARQRHRVRGHGLAPTAGSAEAGGRSASLRAARAPGVHSQDAAFGAVGSRWAFGCTDGPWGRGHTNGGVGAQSPLHPVTRRGGGLAPAGPRPAVSGGRGRRCRRSRGKGDSGEREGRHRGSGGPSCAWRKRAQQGTAFPPRATQGR